jgi:hypothetical protein
VTGRTILLETIDDKISRKECFNLLPPCQNRPCCNNKSTTTFWNNVSQDSKRYSSVSLRYKAKHTNTLAPKRLEVRDHIKLRSNSKEFACWSLSIFHVPPPAFATHLCNEVRVCYLYPTIPFCTDGNSSTPRRI